MVVTSGAQYVSYKEGIRLSLEELNNPSDYDQVYAYGQSKLANVLFTQELASRMQKEGVNVLANSFNPGFVMTPVARIGMYEMLSSFPSFAVEAVLAIFETLCWTASDASITGLYLSASKAVRDGGLTAKYFHPIARQADPDPYCANETMQRELWKLTEDFLISKGYKAPA